MASSTSLETIKVIPTGLGFGADIVDFDIANMTKLDANFIHKAWLENLVLRFRGQDFGDKEQVDFTRHFGELEFSPRALLTGEEMVPGYPEVGVISNLKDENGKPLGTLGNGECFWHTDMSYIEKPPTASLLHALEIPPYGGNTEFLSMYTALETLPSHLLRLIEGRMVKHENVTLSDGSLRVGMEDQIPKSDDVRDWKGPLHPIIRTHPETKRKCLFLGRRVHAYIEGLSVKESEEILDELWEHITQPKLVWTHEWEVGDLILWDNRCVMHRRDPFDASTRRIMHRTQLRGERPV
jgi:taurine dioxygenase